MYTDRADQILADRAFALAIASSEHETTSRYAALKKENVQLHNVVQKLTDHLCYIQDCVEDLQDCESTKQAVLQELKKEKEFLLNQLATQCDEASTLINELQQTRLSSTTTSTTTTAATTTLQQLADETNTNEFAELTSAQRIRAAASAEKRMQDWRLGGAGNATKTTTAQQLRKKQDLIGRIEAAYKAINRDMPLGVPSCNIDVLQRHLDHITHKKERS